MTQDQHPLPSVSSQNMQASQDVLEQIEAWRGQGLGVVLATVIETWGSSPRPVGSLMGINERGDIAGSVSAGCVEGAVISEAKTLMVTGARKCLDYGVTDEMAWDVGLACGGRMRIFLDSIMDADADTGADV